MNNPLPKSQIRRSRWPGLIWAVPVAALAIVAWLALKTYMNQGPSVTVQFPTMGGIKADHTVVKYRGVTVGHVTAVKLSQSLGEISVTLRFDNYMAHHLGKGTRYWIAGEKVSFSNLSSLKSIIAGPYIGIDPHPGRTVHHVMGLHEEPVLKSESKGITLILHAPEKGNISRGAPILYKGEQVGEVRGETLQKNGEGFDIYAFLPEQSLHLANSHSRFWSSGNIAISLFGAHPGVHVPAIPALLSGAISFSTPKNGAALRDNERFALYPNASAAKNAPLENAVPYQLQMPGGPQGLKTGAAVMLEGAHVGSVSKVHMFFDADRQALFTNIQIQINPAAIPLSHGQQWDMAHPAAQMNGILRHLIAQGLRAQLGTTVPLLGDKVIDLDLVPLAKPARLMPGHPLQIPMVQAAGIQDTMHQVNAILDKIHALPLQQIAENLNTLTHNLSALSSSPETRKTLQHVQQTMAHLDQLSKTANNDLPAILKSLQGASKEANAALQAGNALLHNQGAAANSPESTTLPRALYELSRTAQSLRELTDYLNSHPNALIFGKRP
ncbi:MlaD family protein [Acidithiobacillus montserratensis]|uniref:MlaD family protein n=1 Tax=Acidithiobacillus montserratensis TaxID=2729135 RepID=A0ACD5HC20_9PROT|nr:MlaD family protein [Acidithiobacillus montserratensis]MBN2679390.1 MCE family protein [Acidithiobacillaceae bacterium]MBU2746642.1 MCE family protein [Acidithiobacillus montserratensis]